MKKLFTLVFLLCAINILNAQALLIEDFNYTSTGVTANDSLTNTAIGGAQWKRHSGTLNPILWSTPGLTYAGYTGSGVGGGISFAHGTGSREDANIALSDSIKLGSVYASFLLKVTASGGATGDYFTHFLSGNGSSPGSDFKGRIFFKDGSVANTFKLGLSKGSTSVASVVYSSLDFNIGQTYLVVMKYTINPSTADDAFCVYIFSSGVPATEPSTPDLAASVAADLAVADISKIYGFAIRQGSSGTGAGIVDAIRVSTSWNSSPLPVTIKSFSASLLNNSASLVWNTTNENNVDGFTIERSNDGNTYTNIGFVAAKNTTSNSYTFNDVLQIKNATYYRLKITDKDGSFKYSSVIVMNAKSGIKLDIYPNPAINNLVITHPQSTVNSTVKIVNIDGKNLITQNLQNGATQSTIDVSKLIKGNYLVVFENDGTRSATQFVKQ